MEFNGIYKQSKSFQSEALTVETDYEKPPITGTAVLKGQLNNV